MYPFKYYVNVYDEVNEDTYEKHGLLYADNYVHATEKLVSYYGENNLIRFSLEGFEDGPIELEKELVDRVFKERLNRW